MVIHKNRQFLLLFFAVNFFTSDFLDAQDISYARRVIDTLCSQAMFGRGYLKNGNRKAAEYICNEFKSSGLDMINGSYYQNLSYPVNTIPKTPQVAVNGVKLKAGKDFYVMSKSISFKGKFSVVYFSKSTLNNPDSLKEFNNTDFSKAFVVINKHGIKNKDTLDALNAMRANPKKARGIIHIEEKPAWNVATKTDSFVTVTFTKSSVPEKIRNIEIDYENSFIESFSTQNVIAYKKGLASDSFIVFTAHYDHLGGFGDSIYIPGANDNASGVSMILNLAQYYAKNPSVYNIVFMAFTGEEAGLLGSTYYVNNPLFQLSKIKCVLNLDLVGTGDDGVMVVNGSVYKDYFSVLESLNAKKALFKKVNMRGEAANSDHYPFYAKGIPSFFFYTQGGISEYHNIYDKSSTLPLSKFNELFTLMTDFVDYLGKSRKHNE